MKRASYSIVMLIPLLFILYSCEFSPSEIPLTELEKPSDIAPPIRIELTPEMDTLRLTGPASITYNVETGEHQLYKVKITLDNVEIGNISYDSPTKIRAYINSVEDGNHELKITTYTATNSGSIADKMGAEAYWYELTWPVFVNKHVKENFAFNDPEYIPEGIRLSWPKYTYADFDHYEYIWGSNGQQKGRLNITDPSQNFYIDNYVEGLYSFCSIYVYFKEGGCMFDNLQYNKPIKNPLVQVNKDRTADIRWNHSKNEGNVSQYCIKISFPFYAFSEKEHDLTDLNDTTVRLDEKIGFGSDYQVQLRYIPKGYDSYHTTLNTSGGITKFALGDSVPRFEEAFRSTAENSLILYSGGAITKYNISTGKSSQGISISPGGNAYTGMTNSSPDGNYFGYFEGHNYVVRRSSDFSLIKKMDIEAFDGINLQLNGLAISNDGLIGTTGYSRMFRIFDSATGQKIYEKQFDTNYYPRKVLFSPDGKNLAIMANDYSQNTTSLIYYSFDGSQLAELGRVKDVGKDTWEVLAYSPQEKHQLVVSRWRSMYNYNVEVRDSRTFELLYYVEIPRDFVPVAYDFTTERVVAQDHFFPNKNFSYLFNLTTGEQKMIVQFNGKDPLIFNNGIAFSGNGRSIHVDDYIIQ
jgi:hypothetical protein